MNTNPPPPTTIHTYGNGGVEERRSVQVPMRQQGPQKKEKRPKKPKQQQRHVTGKVALFISTRNTERTHNTENQERRVGRKKTQEVVCLLPFCCISLGGDLNEEQKKSQLVWCLQPLLTKSRWLKGCLERYDCRVSLSFLFSLFPLCTPVHSARLQWVTRSSDTISPEGRLSSSLLC